MARKKVVDLDEQEEQEESLSTSFMIHDGKAELRVIALKDCWALQKWGISINQKTGKDESHWQSFKWVTDLGSVANRVFNIRLKNCEATTLAELSDLSKKIAEEIRREFNVRFVE